MVIAACPAPKASPPEEASRSGARVAAPASSRLLTWASPATDPSELAVIAPSALVSPPPAWTMKAPRREYCGPRTRPAPWPPAKAEPTCSSSSQVVGQLVPVGVQRAGPRMSGQELGGEMEDIHGVVAGQALAQLLVQVSGHLAVTAAVAADRPSALRVMIMGSP